MAVIASQRLEGADDIQAALVGLVARNLVQMRSGDGHFPALVEREILYRREPKGIEHWRSARELVARGKGDCEDLCAYHVAWLRHTGRDPQAKCIVYRVRPGLLHVVVELGDGRRVDPSKVLGMKGAG